MAVAALIISILSAVLAVVMAARQDRLQHRMATIEEARRTEEIRDRQRAELTATFRRDPNPRLILINDGSAIARDVTFDPGELAQQGVLRVLGCGC